MKVSKHTAFDPKEAGKFYNVLKSKTTPTNELIGNKILRNQYKSVKGRCVFVLQYKNFSDKF